MAMVAAVLIGFFVFDSSLQAGIRAQQAKNAAARPWFDSVVTRRIAIGDSVEQVIRVLDVAGLKYADDTFQSRLAARHSTGPGSGILILVHYDAARHVSKVEVSEGNHCVMTEEPNKALEPTPPSVMPRAVARVTPAGVVAHL